MIHKSEEKLTASPYRSQNPIMLSRRRAHACCHEPSFCANTSRSESRRSSLSWVFKYVMWAPWRLRSQSQVPVWRVPSTPEDYCYLVRHVMKLNWTELNSLFPLHERRACDCDVRDGFAVLLESWRTGRMWGGGIVKTCASSPLYTTHTSSTPCPLWTFTFSLDIGLC